MALYRYVKQVPKSRIRTPRIVPFLFFIIGFLLLGWTLWPIISFSTLSEQFFTKTVSPVADGKVIGFNGLNAINTSSVDYSNANMWFPTKPQKKVITLVNTYMLSIPKLKIENAIVSIASDDLSQSLIHYGGTPFPGQYGNAVIFGHSTLPQFFKPTNYTTIFSTLPTLKKGDQVYITYDGIKYAYTIYDMIVVDPTDLSPLEQKFDDSYITLVTCVPPGTYWKRLNVKAKLDKNI